MIFVGWNPSQLVEDTVSCGSVLVADTFVKCISDSSPWRMLDM